MKRAVLSAVHGNLEALDAVLRDIDARNDRGGQIAEILCLGDVVGLGPDPMACLARVKERCSRVLLGDHERRVVEKVRKPLTSFDDLEEGLREGLIWTVHQLFGSDAWPSPDGAATTELLGRVFAPDYESKLAEEVAKKAEHAWDLAVPLPQRMIGGETGMAQGLLKKMLQHSGIRGLVIQFMHKSKIRREADEWLRWLGALPASSRLDQARLVHDNPFTPGDGRPLVDAPDDPAKPVHAVSKLFGALDWGSTTLLLFGHARTGGIFRDASKPGLVAATPGAFVPGAAEAGYLLWDTEAEARVELVRVPVGSSQLTLDKMSRVGLPLPP